MVTIQHNPTNAYRPVFCFFLTSDVVKGGRRIVFRSFHLWHLWIIILCVVVALGVLFHNDNDNPERRSFLGYYAQPVQGNAWQSDKNGQMAMTMDQRIYRRHSNSSTSLLLNRAWRPSHAWLTNCSNEYMLHQQSGMEKEKNRKWNTTRSVAIGDCIKFCRCHPNHHPAMSFNVLYSQKACQPKTQPGWPNTFVTGGNLTLMDEIHQIQHQQHPDRFRSPESDAVVIHLRLGDVVEKSKATIDKLLIQGASPGYNPKNFPFALKGVLELLDNLQHASSTSSMSMSMPSSSTTPPDSIGTGRGVRIVGGNHRPQFTTKSRVYAQCTFRAIQVAGYAPVALTMEGTDPDDDFYYASHAQTLIVSAGSFSNLMGRLVEWRGGRIVGRSFGIDWN